MRRSSKSWRPSAERRRQHSEATASPGRPRTLAGTHGKCIPRPNPFRNRESSFNPRNRASCSCPVPTTNSIAVNADPARANHGGVDPQRKIGLGAPRQCWTSMDSPSSRTLHEPNAVRVSIFGENRGVGQSHLLLADRFAIRTPATASQIRPDKGSLQAGGSQDGAVRSAPMTCPAAPEKHRSAPPDPRTASAQGSEIPKGCRKPAQPDDAPSDGHWKNPPLPDTTSGPPR